MLGLPIPLLLSLALALPSSVAPTPLHVRPQQSAISDALTIPLVRRSTLGGQASGEERLALARQVIAQKYGSPEGLQKRQSVSAEVSPSLQLSEAQIGRGPPAARWRRPRRRWRRGKGVP